MTLRSSWTLQKLAYAVHRRCERDDDVHRRAYGRAAVEAWRGGGNARERAEAARLVLLAARRYGVRPAPHRRGPTVARPR